MNLKTLGLAAVLVTASAVPALADSACMEPIAPAAVDGGTATLDQMKATQSDVKMFLKQSDDYQGCLFKELNDQKKAALKDKKDLDPSVEAGVNAKVQENQQLKEKVGAEFNASVAAYNAKHPH
jgi:hypothetical protein